MTSGLAVTASGTTRRECLAWAVALAAVAIMLALGRFQSRDPDSALYAAISSDLAARPLAEWIAPEWNGHWTLAGLYREHPAGVFVPPAAVARLGYPPQQAAFLVNAIYQVLTLLLMTALSREFLARRDSRMVVSLLLLLPIAFAYRIRANQEQPLLMFLLAALYGIERSRASLKWAFLATAGLAGLFVVKGVFVVVAISVIAAWLAFRQWRWPDQAGGLRPWSALGAGVVTLAAMYFAYDAVYARVAGEPFFPWYWARQFGVARSFGTTHPWLGALYSAAWYAGRVAWYAAPWSAVGALGLWRAGRWLRRPPPGQSTNRMRDGALKGAAFCAIVSTVYLVAFSVFERRADRYIFPVYYFAAAWWAVYAFRLWPALKRRMWRATRAAYPYEQAALWFGTFLLALAASLYLPDFTFWR
jgi:4-amino-4-deoxy-L-arabinose transferase-like glycosyltransferase